MGDYDFTEKKKSKSIIVIVIIAILLILIAITTLLLVKGNKNKKSDKDLTTSEVIEKEENSQMPKSFAGDFNNINSDEDSDEFFDNSLSSSDRDISDSELEAQLEDELNAQEELLNKELAEAEKMAEDEAAKIAAELEAEEKRIAEENAKRIAEEKSKLAEAGKNKSNKKQANSSKSPYTNSSKKTPAKDKLSLELDKLFREFENCDTDVEKNNVIDRALTLSKQVLSKNQNNSQAHFFLAQDSLRNKKYDNARKELERAINSEENYLYYYELGKILYRGQDFNGAIRAFKRSCQLNMHFAPSRYNLGLSYVKVNKIDQALSSYKQAIAINPNYEQAYLGKARLYKQVKYYNDAVEAYEKVIDINPGNIPARMDLGVIYNELGRYSNAISMYKTALKYSKAGELQTILKYNLSVALFNNGITKEALTIATQSYNEKDYVKDVGVKANIVYNYGLILDTCEKYDDAIAMYEEALTLNRNHLKAKINLSAVLMKQEKTDVDYVLSLLREAYVVAPSNFEVNNNLGNAYVLNGDFKNAVIYFENALNLDPKDKVVKQNLANAYLKAEDYENAKIVYIEILEDDEENWQANLDLAKVYVQLNDNINAIKYLEFLKTNNPDFRTQEVSSLMAVLKS